MKDVWIAGAAFVFGWLMSKTRQDPACCGIGSWGGRCLSLAPYVRGTRATRGGPPAGGR